VVQDVNYEFDVYASDIVEAILSTSLVVADCRTDSHAGQADSDVTYCVGIAKAMCKPLIRISSEGAEPYSRILANSHLMFDPSRPGAAVEFRAALGEEMEKLYRNLQYPFLLDPESTDACILQRGALYLGPELWPNLAELLQRSVDLSEVFLSVSRELRVLSQLSCLAWKADQELAKRANQDEGEAYAKERWDDFCSVFRDEYLKIHQLYVEPLYHNRDTIKQDLKAKVAKLGHSCPDSQIHSADRFIDLIIKTVVRFQDCHDDLLRQVAPDGAVWPKGPHWFHNHIGTMITYSREISAHTGVLIKHLLALLGVSPQGGSNNYDFSR
jgi:hypothetical protein